MSYKDGIPLLTSFEDGADDDDDFNFDSAIHPRRRWLNKKHCLFALVLTLAVFLVLGIILGITVPVVILQGHGSTGGQAGGNGTTSAAPLPSLGSTLVTHQMMTSSVTVPGKMSMATAKPSVSTSIASSGHLLSVSTSTHGHTMVPTSSPVDMATSTGQPKPISTPPVAMETSTGQPKPISTPPVAMATSTGQPKPISTPPVAMATSTGQPKPIVSTPSVSSVAMETSTGQLKPTPTPSVTMETAAGQPTPTQTLPVAPNTFSIDISSMPTPTATPTPPLTRCFNPSEVCSSTYDDREYSVLTLDNSLTILLISDPASNISSASMDVAAGSFDDPEGYDGLAHFCEHMLFLGTEKFPNEHVYSQYLSTHGGYDNAFTSTQETNYYFDIESSYFERALDMFSQFFISPLLSEDSVMREIHAVNAEHEKNLQNDDWKVWQLLKNVSNPDHPFSRFSTGSLTTLNQIDIHQQVVDYYHDRYSASNMKLVLYDRSPLENLTQYATQYFTGINNTGAMATSYNVTSFPEGYSGRIIHYYPVSNSPTLTLFWQVTPSLQDMYRNSVAGFINRYLGHEGNTSLIYYLKLQQLATSLMAGVEVQTDTYTVFSIELDLTDKGLASVSDVIMMSFQAVRLLQHLNESVFDDLWCDFVQVNQAVFDWGERDKPRDYTQDTAQTMRVVADAADYLLNPERFQSNFNLVNNVTNQLTAANVNVFIGTHAIKVSNETAEKAGLNSSELTTPVVEQTSNISVPWPELGENEPIYGTPFNVQKIPVNLMQYWSSKGDDVTMFALPGDNPFIPSSDDVMLVTKQNESATPIEIDDNHSDGTSLWWLLDSNDFPQPLVNFRCVLNSTNADETPAWEASSTLFSSFVSSVLQPVLYGATEVGYSLSIDPFPHGLTLSISGLSDDDVMLKYITMVTNALNNSHGELNDEAIFNVTKDSLLTELKNYNFTNLPYRYTYRYIQQVIMNRPYWTNEQIIAELKDLEHSDVVNFGLNNILNNATLMCFAHGNVDQQNATSFLDALTSVLGDRLVSPEINSTHFGHYWRQRVTLDPGNFSVSMTTLNPTDENSVVNVLFQIGDVYSDLTMALHLSLLKQMIGDECFYELRTRQQLGYVVFCFKQTNNMIGSFQVLVQSQEYDPEHVLNSIDEFLQSYYDETIQSDNFTTLFAEQKQVLKLSLQQREPTLGDRTDRLWTQIATGQLHFDYNTRLLSMLSSDSINTTSMGSFYYDNILDSSVYRKLVLIVYGEDKEFEPEVLYPLDYGSLLPNTTHYPY